MIIQGLIEPLDCRFIMCIVLMCSSAVLRPPARSARCRDVAYCSLSCQKEAWATHKKDCRPNYCRMAREALANGIEDKALSPDDIKTLGLALDRMEGGFHIHDISRFQIETGGPLQGCSLPEVQDAHKAMFYMSLLGNFFGVGQGVLVVGKTEDEPLRIGRVVDIEAPVEFVQRGFGLICYDR